MNIEGNPRPVGAPTIPCEMTNERRDKIEACCKQLQLSVEFDKTDCSIFKKDSGISFTETPLKLKSKLLLKTIEDAEEMIKLTQAFFGNDILLYSYDKSQRNLMQEAYLKLKQKDPDLNCKILNSKEEMLKEQNSLSQSDQAHNTSEHPNDLKAPPTETQKTNDLSTEQENNITPTNHRMTR